MRLVIVESPYAADSEYSLQRNVSYAVECIKDSLLRGEAPFASHLIYTKAFDDTKKEDRMKGIVAGFAWMERCDAVIIYADLGISPGMKLGILRARELKKTIETRFLYESEKS